MPRQRFQVALSSGLAALGLLVSVAAGCDASLLPVESNPSAPDASASTSDPASPSGDVVDGQACTADTDCGAGGVCVFGLCRATCEGSCAQTHYACLALYGPSGEALGTSACEPHCDPFAPTQSDGTHAACGAGQTCVPSSHTSGATVCLASTGDVASGGTCTQGSDCQSGMACEPAQAGDTTGLCTPYCVVGQTQCSSGLTCTSYSPPVSVDGQTLGVCFAQPASNPGSETETCPAAYPVACGGDLCCPTDFPVCGGGCGYNCCPSEAGGGEGGGGTGAGSSSGSGSGNGACTNLTGCVSVTSTVSQDGNSCTAEEITGTATNGCGQDAYCRICPVVSGAIDETRCEAFDLAAGATDSSGMYWCDADSLKYVCTPASDPTSCVQF